MASLKSYTSIFVAVASAIAAITTTTTTTTLAAKLELETKKQLPGNTISVADQELRDALGSSFATIGDEFTFLWKDLTGQDDDNTIIGGAMKMMWARPMAGRVTVEQCNLEVARIWSDCNVKRFDYGLIELRQMDSNVIYLEEDLLRWEELVRQKDAVIWQKGAAIWQKDTTINDLSTQLWTSKYKMKFVECQQRRKHMEAKKFHEDRSCSFFKDRCDANGNWKGSDTYGNWKGRRYSLTAKSNDSDYMMQRTITIAACNAQKDAKRSRCNENKAERWQKIQQIDTKRRELHLSNGAKEEAIRQKDEAIRQKDALIRNLQLDLRRPRDRNYRKKFATCRRRIRHMENQLRTQPELYRSCTWFIEHCDTNGRFVKKPISNLQ